MVMQLRDLELRHLVALDAVATEGTFGKAALRLGYTQSAVSQQIAALERLVGGPVFDRPGGPRPVELTPPLGKVVLGHARDIITRVDATGDAVERFFAGAVGRLDIGTFQSVSNVLLPAMVQQLRREHPGVDIRLFEEEDNDAGAQAVLAGELDLAFTIGHRSGNLESMLLLDDPFVLVRAEGRAAERPVPDLAARPGVARRLPAEQLPGRHRARAAGRRGHADVRLPHLRQRRPDGDGPRRHGLGRHAAARRRHPRRRCRRAVHVTGAAAASDLHGVAQGPHPSPFAARMVELAREVAKSLRPLPIPA